MSKTVTDVLEAFEALSSALEALRSAFLTNNAVFHSAFDGINDDTSHAISASLNIWYIAAGDGRNTQKLPGLIGISPEVIPLVNHLNLAKDHFKSTVKHFKGSTSVIHEILHKRAQFLATTLESHGLARLHLKQCYRHIPVLDQAPTKVRFNWYSSGRSIRRMKVSDAYSKLQEFDYSLPHISTQLSILASFSPDDYLAQVQEQVPLVRAYITWEDGEEILSKNMNAPLPIFFPLGQDNKYPPSNQIASTPPEERSRKKRSDCCISENPLIPSLRLHQYLL
ncbi:DNA replication terminus site-binding protein [Neptuniibacter sp. QD37_11]|uniref:DNA replication terminus site-binding protein n=1 Tax=Neptuniibacter sp. QD37_11 TaxID=3398209 RepID=UPI0039F644B5